MEYKHHSVESQSKFVDLAPTEKADETGVYSEAILFATNNPKVSNIALTGPYGSGKTSIIQSFLRKYPRPALHISLAAFVPEAAPNGESVSRQEIERSILQQMLYGADANRLPLSRFKRIQSPGVWSIFKSLFIMLGMLALWYVFNQRENIVSDSFFDPVSLSNWFNLGSLLLAFIFLWSALHHFYVASFGLSLKGISLKDVEIKPAHDDQASILNRHLDEIVYFFQSTKYDLVVIEDIDRFEDAEIFVTLREINSLVNENAGVKRTIRFLYALRDDMFINTDRTKFFEFIIPVIPIINTSNSIDMVLKQGKRLELDERLDRQFLREVSRYLNDLRLIQNIFNEYAIYVANLEIDGEDFLDGNKLLAILIYKNVFPRDFEQLHRGKGILAEILNRQDELIRQGEATYRSEISDRERKLEEAERQTPSDVKELQRIYAMALIEKLPENVTRVRNDGRWIPLTKLVGHEKFDQILQATSLLSHGANAPQTQTDISNLQREVDPQRSYQQRKAEIENKTAENKNKISREIYDFRSKMAALRATKLNELLRLNSDQVQDLLEKFGEHGELARFLVLEGYLDDTYYQYTSLFHSGRLSPNDNKFLIQIRAFVPPEPGFPIDNPKEVIAAMRDEDFRQSFVLNVKLVDSLLSDQSLYLGQNKKLFEFLSSEFESCEDFFDAYYSSGRHVTELLSGLAKAWKNLVPALIDSPNNISHITQLVSNLPETSLKSLAEKNYDLPEFVSVNLPEILARSPELTPERVASLNFEVKDLAAIQEHFEIVRVMFEEGLFELTLPNLEFIYQVILGGDDLNALHERNFTTIRLLNSAPLTNQIDRNFDRYLNQVLLALQENSKEDAPAILEVIRHEDVDLDDLQEFLEQQTVQLPSLEKVPQNLHALLFDHNVIEPKWENCLAFMKNEDFEEDSLINYLDRDTVRKAILERQIPSGDDLKELRLFLFGANSLSDAAYQDYIRALPTVIKEIPETLEPTKVRILIDERKVSFTQENLDSLSSTRSLQVYYVANNVHDYLADPESLDIDDDFREELLRSQIDNAAKQGIIDLMDLDSLASAPERAALIGEILHQTGAKIPEIKGDVAQSLITNSTSTATKISLFNECHTLLTEDEVRHVLDNLPKPFSDIKTGFSTPILKNTPENQELVRWLDSRKIISSWSESGLFKDKIRVNLYRR
uniref:YobI family P-loop NTPase n=1 Tax=Marinobacter salsuginis TaxID=418719 RepID=UPI001E2D5D0A|nr:ATP-binding protein [Marinobacter salsuginis]